MASVFVLKVTVVIFYFVCLQSAHSKARYDVDVQTGRMIRTSLTPIYSEIYQKCRNQICSYSEDYPEKEIIRVMRNTKNMQGLFGIVLNSTFDTTKVDSRSNFPVGKLKKLCSTDTSGETHQPRVLRNVNLAWKFVVNVEGYFQRFTAEICRPKDPLEKRWTQNDSCTDFGFECRQSYQEIYLLTFENGVIDFDKFMIPTTCNCVCDL